MNSILTSLRTCLFLLLLILPLAFSTNALAQFYTPTVASGAGGAGRAAVDPGESVFLNPAALAHLQRYYVDGQAGWADQPLTGSEQVQAVAISDGSISNILPGALTYVRRVGVLPNTTTTTEQDIQVSLAGFPLHGVAFGITGHRQSYQNSAGFSQSATNAHIGLVYNPALWLGLGLVAYDVLPTSDEMALTAGLVPRIALAGNMIFGETFRMRADLIRPQRFNDRGRTDVAVGLETFFRPDAVFRLGGLWKETADQTLFTAGLGYVGPRLSFDYSFQKDQRVTDSYRHMFDLWLPL